MEARREQLESDYEQLWRDYGASLGRLASSYELGAHAREDLLQEIRLAIWVALPRFRGESSLRTFVFRIAHNRALTHVWRRKKTSSSEHSEEPVDLRDGPETAAIRTVDFVSLDSGDPATADFVSSGNHTLAGGPVPCGNRKRAWHQREQCRSADEPGSHAS